MFLKTNGTITPLADYQIEDDDLHPHNDGFSITNRASFSGKFELDVKDYTEMCRVILGRSKPEGKTNNWYRMHGYKMNRRIGRKWISRNMHEFNVINKKSPTSISGGMNCCFSYDSKNGHIKYRAFTQNVLAIRRNFL